MSTFIQLPSTAGLGLFIIKGIDYLFFLQVLLLG